MALGHFGGEVAQLPTFPPLISSLSARRSAAIELRERALRARQAAALEALQEVHQHRQWLASAQEQLAVGERVVADLSQRQERRRAEAAAAAARAQLIQPQRTSRHFAAHPRATMAAEIDLSSDSNFYSGFSSDIRLGGVFVATFRELSPGTGIELEVSLPGGKRFRAAGVVRWSRDFNDKQPELFPGLGVQFTDLPLAAQEAFTGFTLQREPLFFPEP